MAEAISWRGLLEALNCRLASATLPGACGCPLCKRPAFRVYRDKDHSTAWFVCQSCEFAGDPVDLAARVWGTERVEQQLARRGLLNGEIPKHRLVPDPLRHDGKANLATQAEMLRQHHNDDLLAHHVRQSIGTDVPRQNPRISRLVAAIPRINVPGVHAQDRAPRRWKSHLVVTLEQNPGQYGGVWFYAEGEQQTSFSHGSRRSCLSHLQVALKADPKKLIVTPDLTAALSQQLQAVRDESRFTPVAGIVFRDKPNRILSQLPGVVFWVDKLSTSLFREASACHGLISLNPKVHGLSSGGRAASIVDNAKPWVKTMASHLASLTLEQALAFTRDCGLRSDRLVEVVDACNPVLRKQLRKELTDDPTKFLFGQHHVSRRDNRLFIDGREVGDVVLTITDVGLKSYTGRVLTRGGPIRFKTQREDLEQRLMPWLTNLLWTRGHPPAFVQAAWHPHLLSFALKFGNPPRNTEELKIGWNAEAGIVTRKYVIRKDGEVRVRTGVRQEVLRGTLPAPTILSHQAVRALSNPTIPDAFWHMISYMAAAIVADIKSMRLAPVVVPSVSGAVWVKQTLQMCGIFAPAVESRLKKFRRGSADRWPIWLDLKKTHDVELLEKLRRASGAIVTGGGILNSWGIACNQDFALLQLWGRNMIPPFVHDYGPDILPTYLQDLARRSFDIDCGRESELWQAVLDDMSRWWESIEGTLSCDPVCAPPDIYPLTIARVLDQARDRIRFERPGFTPRSGGTTIHIFENEDELSIRTADLQRLTHPATTFDFDRLAAGLDRAGVLRGYDGYRLALDAKAIMGLCRRIERASRQA